jgi:hypothetical protein
LTWKELSVRIAWRAIDVAARPTRIGLIINELLTMTMIIGQDTPAGTTRIHCPACRQRDVEALIIEHAEKVMEAIVVHVSTHTTWWVVCSACKMRLYSKVSGPELQKRSADQLVGVVVTRVSFVKQFLAVAALLLALAPGLGLGLGLIAYVANRKSPGWPRKLSKVVLWITALLHAVFFSLLLLASLAKK